jgi:hypothetical protein
LANKSEQRVSIGQTTMNQYYPISCPWGQWWMHHLSGLDLLGSMFRWPYWTFGVPVRWDPVEKSQVACFHCISLLCPSRCRRSSYYSWQKM